MQQLNKIFDLIDRIQKDNDELKELSAEIDEVLASCRNRKNI